MSDWIDVAAVDELDAGGVILVDVDGAEAAVFNIDSEFYALADVCTHDGDTLADGTVEGYEIECPRHGARFSISAPARSRHRPLTKPPPPTRCGSSARYKSSLFTRTESG
jgi:3-phenylpropionate/trans-cinnamate dioxygenase ferredoxin subunit